MGVTRVAGRPSQGAGGVKNARRGSTVKQRDIEPGNAGSRLAVVPVLRRSIGLVWADERVESKDGVRMISVAVDRHVQLLKTSRVVRASGVTPVSRLPRV